MRRNSKYLEHKYKCKECGWDYKRIASMAGFHGCPQCGSKKIKYLYRKIKEA